MKSDELEQQLQRQPWRPVPRKWRAEILQAANSAAAVTRQQPRRAPPLSFARVLASAAADRPWWREWLWPCPQAWTGLGAIWLLVLVLNIASPEPDHTLKMAARVSPRSADLRQALAEQRRLFAELVGAIPKPVDADRPFVPRPRSERRVSMVSV